MKKEVSANIPVRGLVSRVFKQIVLYWEGWLTQSSSKKPSMLQACTSGEANATPDCV